MVESTLVHSMPSETVLWISDAIDQVYCSLFTVTEFTVLY